MDIDVPPSDAGLAALASDVRRFARQRDLPAPLLRDVLLALDELVSNCIRHGGVAASPKPGGGAGPRIRVRLTLDDDELVIEVHDDAPAFDVLTQPEPPLDQPLGERPLGGLGIHLVRRLMDEVRYAREGGENRVTLRKRIGPRPG
jgi:anti-sigma regulatory factor (Ser/Thr protein kinase)